MKSDFLNTAKINVVILVCLFIQGIYLARTLGAESRGSLALLLTSFNILIILCTLGIRQASAKSYGDKSKSLIAILHSQDKLLFHLLPLILLLIGFLDTYINRVIKYETVILLITVWLAVYSNYRSFIPLAKKNIKLLNYIRLLIATGPFLIFYLSTTLFQVSVLNYLLGLLSSYLIYSLICSFIVQKQSKADFEEKKILSSSDSLFNFIGDGVKYSIPLLLFNLNYKVDQYFISYLLGDLELGVYVAGVTFAEMVWQLPAVLSTVIFAHTISSSENFRAKVVENTKRLMIVLLPLCIFYSYICYHIIDLLYGEEYRESGLITVLLMPGIYAIVAFNLLSAEASGRGKPGLAFTPFLTALIFNMILNYIFIPHYGITAAAIVSSITYLLAVIWYIKKYNRS